MSVLSLLFLIAHDIGITMKRTRHFGSVVLNVISFGLYLIVVFVVGNDAFLEIVDVNNVVFVTFLVRMDCVLDSVLLLFVQLIILNFFIMNSFDEPRLQRFAIHILSIHSVDGMVLSNGDVFLC